MQRLLPELPDLDALLAGVDTVAKKYEGVNVNRFELITLLKTVKTYINEQAGMSNDDKRGMLLAAYVIVLERIEAERWALQGSTLRAGVYSVLGIKNAAGIDDKSRLILLNQFAPFLTTDAGKGFRVAGDTLANRVQSIQNSLVLRLKSEITQIRHALLTESTLDAQLAHVVDDYLTLKNLPDAKLNKDRVFAAQLLQGIASMKPAEEKEAPDIFTSSYRVKMGALLFMMREIGSANSVLYKLCLAMLNDNSPDDIPPYLEINCLLALRNCVAEEKASMALELYGRHTFGDRNQLVYLEAKLNEIVKSVNAKTGCPEKSIFDLSALTIVLAGIGGFIFAAPGVGAGQALGVTVAQTDLAVRPTQFVAGNMRMPIYYALGGVGNYVGNFAATLVIDKTLECAFGLAIGALTGTIGVLTGAAIGISVGQITTALFRKVCQLCVDMHGQITNPVLADTVDISLVKALLALPDDVFDKSKKNELLYVKGVSLFSAGLASSAASAAAAAAAATSASVQPASSPSMRQGE